MGTQVLRLRKGRRKGEGERHSDTHSHAERHRDRDRERQREREREHGLCPSSYAAEEESAISSQSRKHTQANDPVH